MVDNPELEEMASQAMQSLPFPGVDVFLLKKSVPISI